MGHTLFIVQNQIEAVLKVKLGCLCMFMFQCGVKHVVLDLS